MTKLKRRPVVGGIAEMTDDLGPFYGKQAKSADKPVVLSEELGELRGRLLTCSSVNLFVTAGRATLTIVSKKTGKRFTFKFSRPAPEPQKARPIWVSLLSGSDNESSYSFLGTIWERPEGFYYRHSPKSQAFSNAPSVLAVQWLLKCLNLGAEDKLEQCEVWHEGRCGRCGRKLTVPSSVESGFGPECINRI